MRIRRLHFYRVAGVLHIARGPAPDCGDCDGSGCVVTVNPAYPEDPDFDACRCTDGPTLRLRYRPRRATEGTEYADEPPF